MQGVCKRFGATAALEDVSIRVAEGQVLALVGENGGGSLSGGEGSILGTLVGALLMTTIASGCTQMGLPNWVQEIITGAIIVVAVAVDRLRHRRGI